MDRTGLTRRLAGACAGVAVLALSVPTVAGAATGSGLAAVLTSLTAKATASCTSPALTSPFASLGDANQYALVPGESADNFAGTGWLLGGGAKIVTAKLADGTTGSVLDLPEGAYAISPGACVTNSYPTARMMVRGLSGSGTVALDVAYLSSSPSFVAAGQITGASGWSASPILNINPSAATGWQLAWFALTGPTSSGETQVYDLYIDPRMKS